MERYVDPRHSYWDGVLTWKHLIQTGRRESLSAFIEQFHTALGHCFEGVLVT